MKIRFAISLAITLISLSFFKAYAQAPERAFPYPEIPAELVTLQDRTGYLVDHFWERCNFSTALSTKAKLAEAFADYVQFIRHAPRQKSMDSIERLLKSLEKNPQALLFIAEQAESQLFSDSAEVLSDEAYLPFARAVAENKKISKAEKLRYARQADILSHSSLGMTAPALSYTTRDGRKGNVEADTAQIVVLYFNDPECDDCRMARARLDANLTANELIKKGVMKVVALTLDDPSDLWRKQTEAFPKTWIVGAAPDAYDIYDLRKMPSFYILDKDHRIAAKNVDVDAMFNFLNSL